MPEERDREREREGAGKGEPLRVLGVDELVELRALYRRHVDTAPHVLSLIDTKLRWAKEGRPDHLMLFMAPGDSYKTDGTFVVLKQILAHELFVYTLDPKCRSLYSSLLETEAIDFKKIHLFLIVDTRHQWMLTEVIEERGLTVKYSNACDMYCLPKDVAAALNVDVPEEVCIRELEAAMAPAINAVWPHRYEGSERYLADMIEYNGGYGVFDRESGDIASWIIKNAFGQLGMVQTVEGRRKRGYGSLVTRHLCREIARDGHHPFGTVLVGNVASQAMFKKLGFVSLGLCYYLGVESQ